MKILVIDDDEISRLAVVETLQEAGHEVTELHGAIGASRVILQNNIEVVVVDMMMPSIDGDKLARLIRDNRQLRNVKVVLISASEEQPMFTLAQAVGAFAFVGKSQVRTKLLEVIANAGQGRRESILVTMAPSTAAGER